MAKVRSIQSGQPAFVLSASASNWISCQTISPNLLKAYELLFGDGRQFYSLAADANQDQVEKLAREIFLAAPDRLILIDHVPHPKVLLLALAKEYGRRKLPDLYIHVYGDFSLFTADWLAVESVLRKCRVCWIAASDRQRRFVSHFLSKSLPGMTGKCPFPVDQEKFFFDRGIRAKGRRRLGLATDERVVLYSGRISSQKNVIPLVKCFLQQTRSLKFPTRLLLAGSFDDIGSPFFGFEPLRGATFQSWSQFHAGLPPDQAGRVQHLGLLNGEQLLEVYNASDLGVSLSLHHDEDFGMAPAEALCTGSPMILTDWGGYSSFSDQRGFCRLVPLHVQQANLGPAQMISFPAFRSLLDQKLKEPVSEDLRQEIAQEFQARFSIQASAKILRDLHRQKPPVFFGFNRLMELHAEKLSQLQSKRIPMFQLAVKNDRFYDQVYRPYFAQVGNHGKKNES